MRSTRTSAFSVTGGRTKEKLPVWAAFFYLTFELQVYMLFVSSGAKHCPSIFHTLLLAVLDMYR